MRIPAASLLLVFACAKAGERVDSDGPTTKPGDDGGEPVASACPPGQYAVDIAPDGIVTCASIEVPIATAIDDNCTTFFGARDNCDGCTTAPAKFGNAGKACMNGAGVDNTCTTPTLGGTQTPLFGLNLDGDVNDDDKIYGGLHCRTVEPEARIAPCGAGQVVVGLAGSSWTCASLADVVIDYVRSSCALYLGWRDSCDGCTTIPSKWGFAGDGKCMNGVGPNNTCTTATLGTETVNLFGLNLDGDVNGDDKFHFGLDCVPPEPVSTTSTTTCPAGQFVTGTDVDGSFRCESIAPRVAEFFTANCRLVAGWQDNCNGCLTPPTKFGTVRVGSCTLGAGAANTCGTFTLGTRSISLFGLNTDGDVDGNDTFYLGFRCQ